MTPTFDGILAFVGLLVAVVAGVIAVRRPEAVRRQLNEVLEEVESLRKEYNALMLKYWEIAGENTWLKQVLSKHNIEVPPMPDYLKPRMDSRGNITIMVSETGGIQIAGARVAVGHDLVGGDKTADAGKEE